MIPIVFPIPKTVSETWRDSNIIYKMNDWMIYGFLTDQELTSNIFI